MKVSLYGASGHALVIADILEANGIELGNIYDDNVECRTFLKRQVFHSMLKNDNRLIVSIGNNICRRKIVNHLDCDFATAVHPSAIISPSVEIGVGTVIMPRVVINADSYIGRHCILNTAASVDHECVLSDYVHISPQAVLCGNVHVGEGTHIGANSTVIQGVRIGKWATIGAGSTIVKDVPDYAVVVGSPGRIIRYNNPEL